MVYSQFINNIKQNPVCQSSLKRRYNISDEQCCRIFILPFKSTLDSKLRWFQFRIINNILPTNDWLYRINLKDNDECVFCHREKETILHIFANCEEVNLLWHSVQDYFDILPDLTPFIKMYGFINTEADNFVIINQIILIVKYYVYKCKISESRLSFIAIKNMLVDVRKLEYFYAKRKSKEGLHFTKWNPILNLI